MLRTSTLTHLLLTLLVASTAGFPLIAYAEEHDQNGIISIDCGLRRNSSYSEWGTSLYYISDEPFIDTGEIKFLKLDNKTDYLQHLWRLRSFPEGTRNCYRINVTSGTKYTIKASFLYGNYDGLHMRPIFDVHIGANYWDTVTVTEATANVVKEIIYISPRNYVHVCLVKTGHLTPFISSLVFSPLNSTIYNSTQLGTSLALVGRYDTGTDKGGYRYPSDVFDRYWPPFNPNYIKNWASLNTSRTINDSQSYNSYLLPSEIMRTAATPKYPGGSLNFVLPPDADNLESYVYMHFMELEELNVHNESRRFNISYDAAPWAGPVTPYYLKATTIYGTGALRGGDRFSIYAIDNSTHPPILNACEIYKVKQLSQYESDQNDAEAVTIIKSKYGVKRNWQGDPCTRNYLWEGLNCSYDGYESPRIISLNLSSSGLTGEIPPSLSNLTMIQYLDLSNNKFTGSVPDFLSRLPKLRVLNLEKNNLEGSLPVSLVEKWKQNSLLISVCGNQDLITPGVPCKLEKRKKKKYLAIPVLPLIAGFFVVLLTVAAIWWVVKRKRKQTPCMQVDLLMRVHHRNLTRLAGYCNSGTKTGLIYEYVANGNLKANISDQCLYILKWEARLHIALQAAQGLKYLHCHYGCNPPIIHRDVKSSNILSNEDLQAKLSDFGLSKTFSTENESHVTTVVAGTPGCLDPDFGVVLLEIVTGLPVLIVDKASNSKVHVSEWVTSIIEYGDIRSIVDPRLQGNFDANSAWKAVELAINCVSPMSTQRPQMSRVVNELKECLNKELAGSKKIRGIDFEQLSSEAMPLHSITPSIR